MVTVPPYDCYHFRLLLIGDSGVGKSCLMHRFVNEGYNENTGCTVGIDFRLRTMDIDGKTCRVQLWDAAGQERFMVQNNFYKGVQGVIVVYDVTDKESFDNVRHWMQKVDKSAPEDVNKLLIGNKCDLTSKIVSFDEAKELADWLGVPFIEASARTAHNTEQAFMAIAAEIKRKVTSQSQARPGDVGRTTLGGGSRMHTGGGCCK
mmetsp:Transcript_62139/g.178792  ORF Transcript_62139/g.178792 Transcript_62139/m.178792 type:complete len:205 (+) Transcript_62139:84-698(+)